MTHIESTDVFDSWIDGLKDRVGRSRIQARIERLVHGNPGHHRVLTHGVCELKIDAGPGYRVYYIRHGDRVVLLLAGGDKSSQPRDIDAALKLAANLGD